ncbi:MAG: enoyl-CoA hydratase/isomerase family protein [Solirubrobacterales bacterium]
MDQPITIEQDGNVAVLTLADPPLNLFGQQTFDAFESCLDHVEQSEARAMVFRAEGRVFTGGVDVGIFRTDTDGAQKLFADWIATVRRIEALPIPTIAVVHALCLTAGFEVSLGCDFIWAGKSGQFGLVEEVVGLTPGAGGTQRLAERAGPARAREFVMTGDVYDAETLHEWGVVNQVLPDDKLQAEATEFARRLANGPTLAHGATKQIVRAWSEGGVDGADDVTPDLAGGLFATQDLGNAVADFLTKGPGSATFEGR